MGVMEKSALMLRRERLKSRTRANDKDDQERGEETLRQKVVGQIPHLFDAAFFPEALGDHLSLGPYLVLLGHLVNSSSVLA